MFLKAFACFHSTSALIYIVIHSCSIEMISFRCSLGSGLGLFVITIVRLWNHHHINLSLLHGLPFLFMWCLNQVMPRFLGRFFQGVHNPSYRVIIYRAFHLDVVGGVCSFYRVQERSLHNHIVSWWHVHYHIRNT